MKRTVAHAVPACIMICLSATAEAKRIPPGSVELSLEGSHVGASLSFDGTDIGSASETALAVSADYFATSLISVGGGLSLFRESVSPEGDVDTSSHSVGVGGGVTINIPTQGPTTPYFGLGLGVIVYGGDSFGEETGLALPSIAAGLRSFVTERASVNVAVGFTHTENLGGHKDLTSNAFSVGLGISVFLGGTVAVP